MTSSARPTSTSSPEAASPLAPRARPIARRRRPAAPRAAPRQARAVGRADHTPPALPRLPQPTSRCRPGRHRPGGGEAAAALPCPADRRHSADRTDRKSHPSLGRILHGAADRHHDLPHVGRPADRHQAMPHVGRPADRHQAMPHVGRPADRHQAMPHVGRPADRAPARRSSNIPFRGGANRVASGGSWTRKARRAARSGRDGRRLRAFRVHETRSTRAGPIVSGALAPLLGRDKLAGRSPFEIGDKGRSAARPAGAGGLAPARRVANSAGRCRGSAASRRCRDARGRWARGQFSGLTSSRKFASLH